MLSEPRRDPEVAKLERQIAAYEDEERKAYLKDRLAELKKKFGDKEPKDEKDKAAVMLEGAGIKVSDIGKSREW